jgi:hypothetical protein
MDRLPPPQQACTHGTGHQSNEPEMPDSPDDQRTRWIAQRIRADSFEILASQRSLCGVRVVSQRTRNSLIPVRSIDRLIQRELFCRPCHPQTSWIV